MILQNAYRPEADKDKAREIAAALLTSGMELALDEGDTFSQWAILSPKTNVAGKEFQYVRVLQRLSSSEDVGFAAVLYRVKDGVLEECEDGVAEAEAQTVEGSLGANASSDGSWGAP